MEQMGVMLAAGGPKAGGGGGLEALWILAGLAILVSLALLASSRRWWAMRRHPIGAVLTTGGWVAVLIGLLLGPGVVELIDRAHVVTLRPLILFCLGWVGVMVGLQLRLDLPRRLPARSLTLSAADFLLTMLIVPTLVLLVLRTTGGGAEAAVIAGLIGVCSVGFSSEVRSLLGSERGGQAAANLLRAAAGLTALLAVTAYGLIFMTIQHGPVVRLSAGALGLGLGVSLLIAAAAGLLGFWLIRVAGRSESQFLVVLLGLLSFAAGAAALVGFSPLFVGMLVGMILANLPGNQLNRFKRVIVDAEQPVAMALMLTAGVVASPYLDGALPWLLIAVMVGGRFLVKLAVARWWLVKRSGLRSRSPLALGPIRQAPLAIALATGYAVSGHEPATDAVLPGEQLVMIVILVGLATDIAPLAGRLWSETARRRPRGAAGAEADGSSGSNRGAADAPNPASGEAGL